MNFLRRLPYFVRCAVFAAVALLLTAVLETSDVFRRIDYDIADTHSRLLAPKLTVEHVAVIDVDEESMTQLRPKLGSWPYDREVYALVTEYLLRAGALVVAYDVLFSDPRKGDDAFAQALDERVVLGAAALPYSFERDAAYRKQLEAKAWGGEARTALPVSDLTLPRPALTARAGVGVINVRPDGDGIVRRVPLVFSAYGQIVPGLPLALLNGASRPPKFSADAATVTLDGRAWPVTARGEALLRFPSNIENMPTLPFYQVALAASGVGGLEHVAQTVKGRRVIIGSSTAVLGDYVHTPLGLHPGVRVQAITAELLARGQVLKPRAWSVELAVLAAVFALLTVLGHPRLGARRALLWLAFPLAALLAVACVSLAVSLMQSAGLLFALVAGALMQTQVVCYRQIRLYVSNQRLETEKEAARQADRLKGQFLSHITHELRTPLTAIMGFNNINLHQDDLGREQRVRNGEIVDRNCQNMLALVNNLLDQAKLEAGQMAIQRNPDSVRKVVADALATVEALMKGKPVALRAREFGVPELLNVDAFRLRQIVLNLLSNAIKFTDKGEISVTSSWDNGVLTLQVADTGPGMSEEVLQRLFGAFQQADAGVAAAHGGTGLGLTISRNLARLLGGDSEPGAGTTFTVTMSAPATAGDARESLVAEPSPDGEAVAAPLHGTVLVAEDMPDIRAEIVRHLERLGLTVLQTGDGEQAVEITLSKRPDAVLMNMALPVIPGVEATRTLRLCGYSAPILAITAREGAEPRRLALAAGCNAVLAKPVTRAGLQAALESALAARPVAARERVAS
jgi:signal transduction histidine kinase/ActR/RegA family two-component response regulator